VVGVKFSPEMGISARPVLSAIRWKDEQAIAIDEIGGHGCNPP